jgi:type I restriction enzyme S subunit
MSDWQQVALGEICSIEIGGTPSRSESRYWWKSEDDGARLPWVSISDMKEKVITDTKESITEIGSLQSNCKHVPKGTLLMSFKLTIGRLAFAGRDLYTNEAISAIRPFTDICPEFLYYGLQHWNLTGDSDQAVKGVTLNKQKLQEIPCLLPPLPEQKKIAEILSGIDQRLSSLRNKKQKVEDIYRACSSDLFGSVSNQVPLNDICDLQVGFPFRSTDFRADGIRLLRGENVGYGKPDWERSQFLPPSLVESGRQYHLNAGDIVIGMDRSFTKQGFKVSRISQGDLPCLLVQRVGRFMPKRITGSYLWHILQSVQYQAILSTSEKGMDIPHLSKSEILEPLVPLADDEQQAQICTCLDSLMYSLSAVSCSIKITAQLAIALRSDLLSGRKRVTL